MDALKEMADLRQARLSADTLVRYAENLSEWELSDLLPVIKQFSLQSRKKGETAFPAIGDIIERLYARKVPSRGEYRSRADSEQQERYFWAHVDFTKERTGETEQEVLDAIKTPGFTGRKARQVGSDNERRAAMVPGGGAVEISSLCPVVDRASSTLLLPQNSQILKKWEKE